MQMDTAPKDGTEILAFGFWAGEVHGPEAKPRFAVVRWAGGESDYAGYEWKVCGTDAYAAWFKPMRWWPLPAFDAQT